MLMRGVVFLVGYNLFVFWACFVRKKWENSMQTEISNLKGCVSSLLRGKCYETIFNSTDVDYWWCSSR
ncbi:hypothetical protein VCHA50P415_30207 [Vibrio chagasii]|nr:hypothetical protein VCHA34P117_100167 [Vibrio chagasii]CAH6813863.1 hypothetical protein VCHA35P150_120120 [Vibrio chagasii]CAH6887264.1 hypothetical protein VCHA34P121_20475 [Vibrio chagasii]CAH6887849.1 hypothetical protein VCHA34P131_30209 [Vibrio chagasii]CAH6889058.1 hypothetical protein VCHA40O236_100010 [Vibrio chagasii]